MRLMSFPGCCTTKILVEFGQERAAEFQEEIPKDNTPESLESHLLNCKRMGYGLVTAVLTQNQTHGIDLLEGAGFKNTGWVSKDAHPETEIALFYLSLKDWKPQGAGSVWIRHRGSRSVPERARGKRVVVRYRDGDRSFVGLPAEGLRWTCNGTVGDIMAYKIVGGE